MYDKQYLLKQKIGGFIMNLPEQYIENMKKLLGEKEFQQYLNCFEQKRYAGIRINTLKWSKEEFLKTFFEIQVPYTPS